MEDKTIQSPSFKKRGAMILALLCVLMMALSSIAIPPISADDSSEDETVGEMVLGNFVYNKGIKYRVGAYHESDDYYDAYAVGIVDKFANYMSLNLESGFTYEENNYAFLGIDEGAFAEGRFSEILVDSGVMTLGYYVETVEDADRTLSQSLLLTTDSSVRLIAVTKALFDSTNNSYKIPTAVTKIDYGVFGSCDSLKSIDTSSNTNFSFENGALYNKGKTELIQVLTNCQDYAFVVPETVTTINTGVFWRVHNLTSVTISSNSISIKTGAFVNCNNLVNVIFKDTVYAAVVCEGAFMDCYKLTTVDFSKASVTFGYYEEPVNTAVIGVGYIPVFFRCENVTSVAFGDNAIIYSGAFYNYSGNLYPEIATRLGVAPNANASGKLDPISFVDEVTFGNNATVLHHGFKWSSVKNVTFGNNAKIGDYAFISSDNLSSVEFGKNPHIGYCAFGTNNLIKSAEVGSYAPAAEEYPCYALETLTFSETGDIYIDDFAFYGCYSLKSLEFNNKGSLFIGEGAFFTAKSIERGYTGIETLIINSTVDVTISYGSFMRNNSLKTVIFGNCKTLKIEEGAFRGDIGMTTLEFGSGDKYLNVAAEKEEKLGIKELSIGSFAGCTGLKKVDFNDGNVYLTPNLAEDENRDFYTEGAFTGCTGLVDVLFSNGTIQAGPYSFAGCENLKTVTAANCATVRIGICCFTGCEKLETVEIDANFIDIGSSAFSTDKRLDKENVAESRNSGMPCVNLKSVDFGDAVVSIGIQSFWYCVSLESVKIENLAFINGGAFGWCVGLKEVYLKGYVDSTGQVKPVEIGEDAFRGCTMIETITLENIAGIRNYAFAACKNVKELVFVDASLEEKIVPRLSEGCFAFNDGASSRSYDVYSSGWANEETFATAGGKMTKFSFHVRASGEIEEVSVKWTYDGDEGILSFTGDNSILPMDYLRNIVYSGDENLKKIVFGEGIRFIYGYSLASVSADGLGGNYVEEIEFNDGLEYIGVGAFSGFAKLKSIVIPAKVTLIDDGAFFGCRNVKEIIFLGDDPAKNVTFGTDCFNLGGPTRMDNAVSTKVSCTVYSNSTGHFLDKFGNNVSFDYKDINEYGKPAEENNSLFVAVIVIAVVLILLGLGVLAYRYVKYSK